MKIQESARGYEQEILKVIEKSGGRMTKERLAILQALGDIEGHFFPEDLEQRLKRQGVNVSLTTIYRNLPLLVEAGIIRRACLSEEKKGGGTRYEHIWGRAHHDHLVCSRCACKVEFNYPAIDVLQEAVAASYGFKLERHHLELIGLCSRCQEKEDNVG